ncbi:MAG: hypothetical protein HYY17_09560 [Planctomycetes bacterium]|nr:hypothetical protein [Planctomycetota bacterium]
MRTMTWLLLLCAAAPAQDEGFIPLKKGTRWVYSLSDRKQVVQEVTGTEKVGDVECFVIESDMGGQKEKMWVLQNAEGIWLHKAQSRETVSELGKPALLLKYPLKKEAEGWTARIPSGSETIEYSFTNEGEEALTVHGKSYQAWRIRMRGRTQGYGFEGSYWYAKGVGLVKQVITSPGGEFRLELKEFK